MQSQSCAYGISSQTFVPKAGVQRELGKAHVRSPENAVPSRPSVRMVCAMVVATQRSGKSYDHLDQSGEVDEGDGRNDHRC